MSLAGHLKSMKDCPVAEDLRVLQEDAIGFAKMLKRLKVEACIVEAFRTLKVQESIKKVVRREFCELAGGGGSGSLTSISEDDLMPQTMKNAKGILENQNDSKK